MAEKNFVPMRCSFCGKSQHEVRSLLASAKANICEECIISCVLILDEEPWFKGEMEGERQHQTLRRILD
jgi:ATP-dependent Clp protease ATP-binding subunit ClpX